MEIVYMYACIYGESRIQSFLKNTVFKKKKNKKNIGSYNDINYKKFKQFVRENIKENM